MSWLDSDDGLYTPEYQHQIPTNLLRQNVWVSLELSAVVAAPVIFAA